MPLKNVAQLRSLLKCFATTKKQESVSFHLYEGVQKKSIKNTLMHG